MSRQGANIEIVRDGETQSRGDGPYGGGDRIVQEFHPLPEYEGNYPLVVCWLVAGTDARIVPHLILD